jgi:hypothetical protein
MVDSRRRDLGKQLALGQVRTAGGSGVGAGLAPTVSRLAATMREGATDARRRGAEIGDDWPLADFGDAYLEVPAGAWYFHSFCSLGGTHDGGGPYTYGFSVIGASVTIGDYRPYSGALGDGFDFGFSDSAAVVGPVTLTPSFFLPPDVSYGQFEMQAVRIGST